MEKVLLDEIVNQSELPLASHLECPIDSMVPLNPLMCKNCETIFCPDCIESWKKRSTICPMRCNPMEIITIDRHVLKNQINKIKLACPFYDSGCVAQLPPNEVSRHERTCEYRPSKCEKCNESVSINQFNSHLYESCIQNKISCFICSDSFSLKEIIQHLTSCSSNSSLCKTCAKKNHSDIQECPLQISQCKLCKLPELNFEIKSGQHKCIQELKEGNLTAYLKSIHSKYEATLNNAINNHDEYYREFNKKLNELSNDVIKRENDKSAAIEMKYARVSDDQSKKLANIKRDKLEYIKKIKAEILEWNSNIQNKNEEIQNINNIYQKNLYLLKSEFELKIASKQKNLEYLRNLLIHSMETQNTAGIQANSNSLDNASSMRISLNCKICASEIPETLYNRCGSCSMGICKKCSKSCLNKQFDHPNSTLCPDCVVSCVLCKDSKHCKTCIKKCFYKNCNNFLCFTCYDKNKHQLRPENTNCKFYKCDNCSTDANCIMTTVYCGTCDKRVCKNCFHTVHRLHMK